MASPTTSPLDPEAIFKQGAFFEIASIILEHDMSIRDRHGRTGIVVHFPTLIPAVVNSCFCIELYLKCMLVIENPALKPRGHSLLDFFNSISNGVQQRIKHYYDESAATDPSFQAMQTQFPNLSYDLISVITESSDSFQKWRYAYEAPLNQGHRASHVRDGTRKAIIELTPAWQGIWDSLRRLPT